MKPAIKPRAVHTARLLPAAAAMLAMTPLSRHRFRPIVYDAVLSVAMVNHRDIGLLAQESNDGTDVANRRVKNFATPVSGESRTFK